MNVNYPDTMVLTLFTTTCRSILFSQPNKKKKSEILCAYKMSARFISCSFFENAALNISDGKSIHYLCTSQGKSREERNLSYKAIAAVLFVGKMRTFLSGQPNKSMPLL